MTTGRLSTKIATLEGVRELTEREPVEIWINADGVIAVRAYNECRNNYTEVELAGLIEWTRSGGVRGAWAGEISALCSAE